MRQLPDISPDAPTQSSLTKADSKRVNANLNGSPSPTSKNVSLVEPSSIPNIDSTGKNVNIPSIKDSGYSFEQLTKDVENGTDTQNPIDAEKRASEMISKQKPSGNSDG